ncbi:MAG: thrombospondin type 3 repeat-containing protein [Acidobacteriota bacterium]
MSLRAACVRVLPLLVLFAVGASAQPMPGQLVIDPDNPMQMVWLGEGPAFIAGPGDPEGFLYRGMRLPDDTRDGDQLDILNSMITHGGNGLYLIANRVGADGAADHNPGIDGRLSNGLSDTLLDGWDEWFTLMEENKIVVHFIFYDSGTRPWGSAGDDVPPEEAEFFAAMVNRFEHLRNIMWVLIEEPEIRGWSGPRLRNLAQIVADADDHDHVVGIHHFQGRGSAPGCDGLIAPTDEDDPIDMFTLGVYTGTGCYQYPHDFVVHNYEIGRDRGYAVMMTELWSHFTEPDGTFLRDHAGLPLDVQIDVNWGMAVGGSAGFLSLYDGGGSDRTEPPLMPDEVLASYRVQQEFFESTDFNTMHPMDELGLDGTTYVMANPGTSYIAYTRDFSAGPTMGLADLPGDLFDLRWYDCTTGDEEWERNRLLTAGDQYFDPPAGLGPPLALWVTPSADRDGDLVADVDDNCQGVPNTDQLDSDADGAGDLCDDCPNDPLDDIEDDGWCADVDNCPESYNRYQEDWDGDGPGDACDPCPHDALDDADADGLCANFDNCPDLGNPLQVDLDADGTGDACDPCPLDALDDADADGFCADVDNCPELNNAAQEDGDGDDVGDACDACPLDALNDADADGLCAEVDNCPETDNADQADLDVDGEGDACDPDIDGDGHLNSLDCAPSEPGDPVPAGRVEDLRVAWQAGSSALSWQPPMTGFSDAEAVHRVVQGELATLRSEGGFDSACLLTANNAPSWSDADAGATVGRYYLVLADNDCGLGPLLTPSPVRETLNPGALPACP